MNALELIELFEEIKRLELDLKIHRGFRKVASQGELEVNEYLIQQTERKLGCLNKLTCFEK